MVAIKLSEISKEKTEQLKVSEQKPEMSRVQGDDKIISGTAYLYNAHILYNTHIFYQGYGTAGGFTGKPQIISVENI